MAENVGSFYFLLFFGPKMKLLFRYFLRSASSRKRVPDRQSGTWKRTFREVGASERLDKHWRSRQA